MKYEIIAMGYIFNEMIVWADQTAEGPYLGATASYGAVALGRLGAKAGFVSNIGPGTPRTLLQPLYDCGIDLTGLNVLENAQETKNILRYRADGTKQIEYVTRAPLIQFEHIPKEYLAAKLYHLCLVDYEVPIETLDGIAEANPAAMFSADLGGLGGAHSTKQSRDRYIAADNGRRQKEYLRRIDIGKASVEDAELAFGRAFATARDVAKAYIDAGVRIAVVTMGAEGAYLLTRDGEEDRIEAVRPDRVVDTTGAGDTYITAFVSEYIRTKNLVRSGYFASATSSLLIEQTGGVRTERTPDREQVEKRLKSFFNNK